MSRRKNQETDLQNSSQNRTAAKTELDSLFHTEFKTKRVEPGMLCPAPFNSWRLQVARLTTSQTRRGFSCVTKLLAFASRPLRHVMSILSASHSVLCYFLERA